VGVCGYGASRLGIVAVRRPGRRSPQRPRHCAPCPGVQKPKTKGRVTGVPRCPAWRRSHRHRPAGSTRLFFFFSRAPRCAPRRLGTDAATVVVRHVFCACAKRSTTKPAVGSSRNGRATKLKAHVSVRRGASRHRAFQKNANISHLFPVAVGARVFAAASSSAGSHRRITQPQRSRPAAITPCASPPL